MGVESLEAGGGSPVSTETALTGIFSDRLNQIINLRPGGIRPGRSRTNDFAAKFNIHYNTAHRLLHGKILPSVALLCSIAEAFDVSESWLLGRGARNVEDMRGESLVKIPIFKPRSAGSAAFATIPAGELPRDFDSTKLLYARTRTERGDVEDVIVRLMDEPQEGKVHLIYDPKIEDTYLRRINVIRARRELLCFTLETAAMETLRISDIVVGKESDTNQLSILGPVVARIKFAFKGD